jgi:hypothetical protein
MFSCTVFLLLGRGLCVGPIPRPGQSYRLCCVSEYDQVKMKTLYIYYEQVGRRGKDYETKLNDHESVTYWSLISSHVWNSFLHAT